MQCNFPLRSLFRKINQLHVVLQPVQTLNLVLVVLLGNMVISASYYCAVHTPTLP